MPSISDTLQNLAQTFDRLHTDYMLIDGYALAAYGLIRATVEIDIAIAMKSQDPMELKRKLENAGFQVPSFTPETPCFVLTDKRTVTEIEVWLKPNGVTMNTECLRRRKRVKIGKFEFWIIGPEDFIVNKLSRKNRRNQDEVDVVSVLKNTRLKLDVPYLRKIAARAGILPLLKAVETKAKQEHFS